MIAVLALIALKIWLAERRIAEQELLGLQLRMARDVSIFFLNFKLVYVLIPNNFRLKDQDINRDPGLDLRVEEDEFLMCI